MHITIRRGRAATPLPAAVVAAPRYMTPGQCRQGRKRLHRLSVNQCSNPDRSIIHSCLRFLLDRIE